MKCDCLNAFSLKIQLKICLFGKRTFCPSTKWCKDKMSLFPNKNILIASYNIKTDFAQTIHWYQLDFDSTLANHGMFIWDRVGIGESDAKWWPYNLEILSSELPSSLREECWPRCIKRLYMLPFFCCLEIYQHLTYWIVINDMIW